MNHDQSENHSPDAVFCWNVRPLSPKFGRSKTRARITHQKGDTNKMVLYVDDIPKIRCTQRVLLARSWSQEPAERVYPLVSPSGLVIPLTGHKPHSVHAAQEQPRSLPNMHSNAKLVHLQV